MFESTAAQAARPASLARSAELQASLTNLLQQIRQAPAILHAIDTDELRQLIKATAALHRKAHLALDIAVALRASQQRQ